MDKKNRKTTLIAVLILLLLAGSIVGYILFKSPADLEASFDKDALALIKAGEEEDKVVGFYVPENISNYVNVPGVSSKLFGAPRGVFTGSSLLPSGATTLALLSAPVFTNNGNNNNNNNNNNNIPQSTPVDGECHEGFYDCNGTCVPLGFKCEEETPTTTSTECNPQEQECPVEIVPPDPKAVPEPATMALFGVGLAGAALRRRFQG